ncbi:MAG TPA: EAL domain-containing protein [Xanthomonadaceae bacterium]|jgi:diguanylate cyclase (GGDEF)-like protein/PAS domain S-box-containing protein
MSRLFRRVLACGFALLLAHAAFADVRDFRFQRVTGEHGLVQNTVSALLQDRDGYIWVGTQGGLHRYDGQDYKLFVQASDDPSSLPDNFVTALTEGTPGTLWVGTNSAYVAELNLATGKFRRLLPSELDHPGELGKRVLALYFDAGHGLWIATEGGIDLLDPATGQRRSILRQPLAGPSRDSYGFASDPKGDLWATLPSGLYRIDPVTLTTQKVAAPTGVADVVSDRKGGLWVSAADGLYRLEPGSGKLERSALSFGNGKDADSPQRIVVDADNRLWLATLRSGLLRFDPASGKTVWIRANSAQEDTLPEDQVNILLIDRSGLLWVGTFTDGVVATDPEGSRFAFITDANPGHAQRYTNSVRSLYQSADGALWVGTDGDGVKRYDLGADRFTGFSDALHAAMPAELASSDIRVYAVQPATDGALWLGTNLGLYWLDPAHGRARAQPLEIDGADAGKAQPLNVRSLLKAAAGGLWVGTQNHGLLELDAAGKPVLHIDAGGKGLSNATVNCLYSDARGMLWIGTMDGLDRRDAGGRISHFLNDPHNAATLSGNRVRAIVPARDGSLWIGTHSGLNRLRMAANGSVTIRRYPVGNDPDHPDTVYGVVEDAHGRLWVSSNNGLLRLDPASGAIRRFTPNDGLQNLEFNGGAYLHLADGRIAFGGIRGLNVFDPSRITDNLYAPPVVLTGTRIGSDPTDRVGLVAPSALRFRALDGVLRLRFSALDFANPSGIVYRYRLEGFDKDWIDAGQRPDATYTNLDAGDYTFHAQATNGDGQWSHNELRIPITVVPPWWDSVPAHIVYVLLVVGAFAVAWRILQQRHRREAAFSQAIERREQQLKMALWGSGDDYWDLDLTTSSLRRSTAGNAAPYGGGIDPIPLAQWRNEVLHPDDVFDVEERLDRHLRGEVDHFESEHRVRHPRSGEWVTILARGKVVERDLDGKPLRISGTARDVSQTQHQERERLIAGEVLSSMSEAVSVIDLAYRFVSVNRAFTLMTGYTEEEITGQNASVLDSSQHAPEFYREMRETMELTGRWSGEMWQRRKDGEEFLCAIEAVEVLESNGQRGHFVAVLNDITEKKRAEQELRYLANFDTLTGLPNRALLSERLARAIVRARRHDTMVAVLFLDLDRFKEINDSLGHTAGDRILKAVASRLQATTSPTDTVSRLGGDEFTVVVEDIASDEAAYQVARNILAAFGRPLIVDERSEVTITPSIGISLYPAHGLAPTDLLKHADTAMYQAKAIGRNTYLAYTESMETQTRQRANITAALRRAVDRNEFQLLYQPRLSLARGRISGVEALLRWHSEELGEMMPGDFIPIAEETGMIVRIGEWALREACKTLALWQREGLTDVRIAVNVSVLQLLRGNLPQLITHILAESGAPPSCLELELTETMIMANAAETRSIFDKLRDMGLSLAIDDFGTGYSSLVYLKQLPIDMLKIDKEFISDLTSDPDDEAITTTIITMAHSLGLTVIAEGVESQDQLDFLREHACDEIQGYWLSQPLSEPHCRTFIHSWHHTTPRPAAVPAAS